MRASGRCVWAGSGVHFSTCSLYLFFDRITYGLVAQGRGSLLLLQRTVRWGEGRQVTRRTRRATPPPGRGRPPHSCLKTRRGLALACGGVDAAVHHAAFTLQAAINFSPMTDSEDLNNNRTVINGVQNAVIPYSCPVPFFAL